MDLRTSTIGVLSLTAIILVVGLLFVNARPEPVWASGMTASGGDYILTVGQDVSVDEELLYVVDVPGQKLIVYRFDATRREIELVQGIDLAQLSAGADPSGQQPQPPKRPYGRRSP